MRSAMHTVVERMHGDFSDLLSMLERGGEISLRSVADDNFRKSLLLCAASFFEKTLCDIVVGFVRDHSGNNSAIVEFVKNKAISRQYHTWFNWKERNANVFFGLFGEEFKSFMGRKIKSDQDLDNSIRAFMEIGEYRNRLLHQDYGNFFLEKSSSEIYHLYRTAIVFVLGMRDFLDEFTKARADHN